MLARLEAGLFIVIQAEPVPSIQLQIESLQGHVLTLFDRRAFELMREAFFPMTHLN